MSEIYSVRTKSQSVVLIGGFSPSNFLLERLLKYNIVSESTADESELQFFHPEGRLSLMLPFAIMHVVRVDESEAKLSIQSTDDGANQLFRDFVVSLMNLFDSTTVTGMGLNFVSEIQHLNDKQWHSFGNNILPKNKWTKIFNPDASDSHCGLTHASIRFESLLESVEKLEDDLITELNIAVRPVLSDVNNDRQTRVSEIRINYHFPINIKSGMLMALKTFEHYYDDLSDNFDTHIESIVTENTDV